MAVTFKPGRYSARAELQRFTESPQKGTLGLCIPFTPQKNLDDSSVEVKPLPCELTIWFADTNYERSMNDVRRLGYPGETLEGLDPDTDGFYNFAGQEIEVICTHKPGSWGDNVERWDLTAPTKPNLKNKAKIQALDQRMARKRAARVNSSAAENRTNGDVGDFDHSIDDSDLPS